MDNTAQEKNTAQDKNRNRWIITLVIILCVAIFVSSSIVSYILGQHLNDNSRGQVVDTIILDPGAVDESVLSLNGSIKYSNETPYANSTIRLQSDPRECVTNASGDFFFYNVEAGKHTLFAVDTSGNIIAEAEIEIAYNLSEGSMIEQTTDGYHLSVPLTAMMVEFDVNINEDTDTLIIDTASVVTLTDEKTVIIASTVAEISNSSIVTPLGTIMLADGSVVVSDYGIILSNGYYVDNVGGITLPDGRYVNVEDSATVSDGTIILLNTPVSLPNEVSISSDRKTVELKDGTVISFANNDITLADNTHIAANETITLPGGIQVQPFDNGTIISNGSIVAYTGEIFEAVNPDFNGVTWTQLSVIDLFAVNDSKVEGKLYPGVSGHYSFSLSNPNNFSLRLDMDITETLHDASSLPILYRIKNSDDTYLVGNSSTWLTPEELATLGITLSADSETTFVIEWKWPLTGNNSLDTLIGSSNDLTHYINVTLTVEVLRS